MIPQVMILLVMIIQEMDFLETWEIFRIILGGGVILLVMMFREMMSGNFLLKVIAESARVVFRSFFQRNLPDNAAGVDVNRRQLPRTLQKHAALNDRHAGAPPGAVVEQITVPGRTAEPEFLNLDNLILEVE